MTDDGEGGKTPRLDTDDAAARSDEIETVIDSGPGAGNRAGALAFLAFAVLVAAALYFHFSDSGGDAYLNRLDSELLAHAEMTLAASEEGSRMTVVPSWPLRLYDRLRTDIVFYCALTALAGYLWGLAARARARRDAFIVHEKLAAELAEAKRRIDLLEKGNGGGAAKQKGTKGL